MSRHDPAPVDLTRGERKALCSMLLMGGNLQQHVEHLRCVQRLTHNDVGNAVSDDCATELRDLESSIAKLMADAR